MPCFSRIGEGRETSLTIDSRTACRIGVKIGLNGRESMLRKTLEESSPILALLELELELKSMYI